MARSLLLLPFFLMIQVVSSEDNGLGLFPPLGWNTWCTEASCEQPGTSGKLHDFCNETEIKQVAEAMLSNGMFHLGYRYVNLGSWSSKFKISHTAAVVCTCN
jgi:alpha-galactosidase